MSWHVLVFKDDRLARDINLDDALAALLRLPAGDRGPHFLSPDAVRTLGAVLAVPLDPDRGRYMLVDQEPPWGWVVRQVDENGPVEEFELDWELIPVFAELLGQSADDMRGPGFADAYPLDATRLEKVGRLFDLRLSFADADQWTLEIIANDPPDA